MKYQNRVDPRGQLIWAKEKGTLMGNRGCLHDADGKIVRQSQRKPWVLCLLEYKGVQRKVFTPGHYSELFFLDEATAFSAGHRPCNTCQRSRLQEFRSAWAEANRGGPKVELADLDSQLHKERYQSGNKVTSTAAFGDLPDGTFIDLDDQACLLWQGKLLQWSPAGYSAGPQSPAASQSVTVLTPPSIVRMFSAGFRPQVHPSAG